MSDSLSSVSGHSLHFTKFPMLRFSKYYCSHYFHPISAKLYMRYRHRGEIQAIAFSGDLPNFKNKSTQLYCHYIRKAMLISSGNKSVPRPLGLLLVTSVATNVIITVAAATSYHHQHQHQHQHHHHHHHHYYYYYYYYYCCYYLLLLNCCSSSSPSSPLFLFLLVLRRQLRRRLMLLLVLPR